MGNIMAVALTPQHRNPIPLPLGKGGFEKPLRDLHSNLPSLGE
ncbi:hypothetical protein Cenrod_0561 [Candidatus Symbiobacter mobilis CR]|uniref:Uncharacterized protein n=1 Tax=Candidatus Symbiobacter mobilis CR TaxID=946483 RepID=U5N903_9BURK|nr:hypothetical protein Cenrod_0561 [Candidatus Symbiobacter mobilis CR]